MDTGSKIFVTFVLFFLSATATVSNLQVESLLRLAKAAVHDEDVAKPSTNDRVTCFLPVVIAALGIFAVWTN